MSTARVYYKVTYMGLEDYYRVDCGIAGPYAENMQDKLRIKTALENDLELEDVEVEVVRSIGENVRCGEIKGGVITD